jgi:hypothetical protein
MWSRLLNEIAQFIQKETTIGFMKSLYAKGDRIAQIEDYYRQIEVSVVSFQVCLNVIQGHPVERKCASRYIDLGTCEHSRLAATK